MQENERYNVCVLKKDDLPSTRNTCKCIENLTFHR